MLRLYNSRGVQSEDDLEFARKMVETLNLILLTAPEFFHLRTRLKELRHHANEVTRAFARWNCGLTVSVAGLGVFLYVVQELVSRPRGCLFAVRLVSGIPTRDCSCEEVVSPVVPSPRRGLPSALVAVILMSRLIF